MAEGGRRDCFPEGGRGLNLFLTPVNDALFVVVASLLLSLLRSIVVVVYVSYYFVILL